MIKKISVFILLFITGTILVFSGAFIERFTATSENNNVIIEWKSGAENNLKQYEIERKSGNSETFISIAIISPGGSNSSYRYEDRSAYKTMDAIYIYRLKIVENDPSISPTYSNTVTISHRVSGVKSTWGSIKSMFR
jgi:hypothetical protein